MTDKEIIASYLSGNKSEIDLVRGWVGQVVHARMWEPDMCKDDIIADTTLKLLVSFRESKFAFDSSLKTYVQRITMFTLIDAVRAQRRARRYLNDLPIVDENPQDPTSAFSEKEDLLLFHRIFLHMDRQCREIWILILHDQLTYKEIADRLKIAEGTVKTRVFRCKEKAKEIRDGLV